ncbi:MAG: hypothetical protein JWQ38_2119 [Flavipsychrobacter sp.]|nr:hypothetical protein [Flavipsychrobacter sp.]
MNNNLLSKYSEKNIVVFGLLWVLTLGLYLPAVKAGWTIDAVGWIYNLKHLSFWDFINCTQSATQSMYQLYALDFLVFYKLFGVNPYIWSIIFISFHALNAFLVFRLCKNIFSDSGINNGNAIALCGTIIFTVCPHISEVLIWKACFHYLQGFMFILLSLLWVQQYQKEQKGKYIIGATLLFILSAFSLEIFYLTPFFILTLALYYHFALGYSKEILKKTMLFFFVPHLLLLAAYFIGIYARYKFFTPHVNNVFSQSLTEYFSKPPKYLFHIITLGRYFSIEAKEKVSAFCGNTLFLIVFYSGIVLALLDGVTRFKKLDNTGKAILLLSIWSLMTIAFLMPLAFPGTNLLAFYDRYTYFADGFIYILLALVISRYVNKYIAIAVFFIYAGCNIFFTMKVNKYWKHSAYITNRLLNNLPDAGNKTVLLLNLPENMNGIPMIGAQPEGEYKMMQEILTDKRTPNAVYDVASYNMLDEHNGVHITISSDSIIHVTLNQWKTWWWYMGHGAKSYENAEYKMNMLDPGHWYELVLKKPASEYMMLYQTGDQWKVVNMNKRDEDQY